MSVPATPVDIRTQSLEQLQQYFVSKGEPTFRAKQVYQWLWEKSCTNIAAMSNLGLQLREQLQADFVINPITVAQTQVSSDRTIKSTFQLHDEHLIEGVLIPTRSRMTACVSSQVGCSLSCKFCATGYMDRKRNLDPAEIYDQVVLIKQQAQEHYNQNLTNIVFMGMGEPLLNYKKVLASIDKITSPQGLGMSPRRITVSTAGIAKMIKQLADDQVKFNLALSLHAANDEKRSQIMPINDSNRLEVLKEALQYFYEETGTPVTFEYIVFHNLRIVAFY